MKKLKKISLALFIILLIISVGKVFAAEVHFKEYSEEFKEYLQLSDEEKSKRLMPRMYDIEGYTINYINPIKYALNVTDTLASKYSLLDYIPENIVIRNQMNTNSCWAFGGLSSLETTLALSNYYNNKPTQIYDYSERHVVYATSKNFANGVINPHTFNKQPSTGGNQYILEAYLTSGIGAIDEAEMPFENNENLINISKIQNKTVTSQIFDSDQFESSNTVANRNRVKQHIKNYGAVAVGIHGANPYESNYYNNSTGAIYCNDSTKAPVNHMVSIVGWDDNYSRTNFNSNCRPSSNGAWIIRNSWGTVLGNKGFMYLSYEDVNFGQMLYGIIKASDTVDYNNVYQYNYTGANGYLTVTTDTNKIYMATVFNKNTTSTEYIKRIGTWASEPCKCRVYVNLNGSGMSNSDLQLVQLKEGNYETLDTVGYHTLELQQPLKINSSSFVVVLEITPLSGSNQFTVPIEAPMAGTWFSDVEISNNNFYTGNLNSTWKVVSDENNVNLTTKVFTSNSLVDNSLKDIQIQTPPTKTTYYEGENFDATGMVVKANYNDGTSKVITDYNISNGSNLTQGQQYVTISYKGKQVRQNITVNGNVIDSIVVAVMPNKTTYIAGENFDPTGMVVKAVYKSGVSSEITGYQISGGTNLQQGEQTITITYNIKSTSTEKYG